MSWLPHYFPNNHRKLFLCCYSFPSQTSRTLLIYNLVQDVPGFICHTCPLKKKSRRRERITVGDFIFKGGWSNYMALKLRKVYLQIVNKTEAKLWHVKSGTRFFFTCFSCSTRKFDFIASPFSDVLSSIPVSEKWASDIFSHVALELMRSVKQMHKGAQLLEQKETFIYTPIIPEIQNRQGRG